MPVVPALPRTPPPKRQYVREIFSDIAPSYDLLNRLLSMSIDRSWRREAVARLGWETYPHGVYLDGCAGTLDLANTLARKPGFTGKIVATDFAVSMLRLGVPKPPRGVVMTVAGDTLNLPIRDQVFDGAMVGFGVRNLDGLNEGLAELARVLRRGARLVVLDFTTPTSAPLRALYLFYFKRILPVVGRLVSGHPTAYSYLPDSVIDFPAPVELKSRMAGVGLRDCGHRTLTGGIAAVTWGVK